MSGSASRVEGRGITVVRRGRTVINDATVVLDPGITALAGPNGAGKSTLLGVLASVTRPTRGTLLAEGTCVRGRARHRYRKRLGYLPQDPTWHAWMTVTEVVRLFAWLRGVRGPSIDDAVRHALQVTALEELGRRRIGQISGGEHQRVMLATALVHRPHVLVLDEPTVGLDPGQRIQFRRVLQSLSDSTVVLISTHLLDDVAVAADRILVMNEGSIVFSGSPDQLSAVSGDHQTGLTSIESGYLPVLRDGQL